MGFFKRLGIYSSMLGALCLAPAFEEDITIPYRECNMAGARISLGDCVSSVPQEVQMRAIQNISKILPLMEKSWKNMAPYAGKYESHAMENGIPKEFFLSHPVVESGVRSDAVSHAGAAGIFQFMKWTAKKKGLAVNEYIDERLDPEKSSYAAASYLREIQEYFDSWELVGSGKVSHKPKPILFLYLKKFIDPDDLESWLLPCASYNAGMGRVRNIIIERGKKDYLHIMNHLPRETQNHVPKILAATKIFGAEYGKKFQKEDANFSYLHAEKWETISKISRKLKRPAKEIMEFNPQIRKAGRIPPGTKIRYRG